MPKHLLSYPSSILIVLVLLLSLFRSIDADDGSNGGCVVSEWSEWSPCRPTSCRPCDYGGQGVGIQSVRSTTWTSASSARTEPYNYPDPPALLSDSDMEIARGAAMQAKMDRKKLALENLLEHALDGFKMNSFEKGGSLRSSNNKSDGGKCSKHGYAAHSYPCNGVDLDWWRSRSDIGGYAETLDDWGWTDPKTSVEYVLISQTNGVSFLRVDDGVVVGNLPGATSHRSLNRDVKTYSHYALDVSESSSHGLQIFDLDELNSASPGTTFKATKRYRLFGNAHNIVVNEETARVYIVGSNSCGGGLHAIDFQNPLDPKFLGCAWDTDYVHDAQCVIYHGPDDAYSGKEICFLYSEGEIRIVDMSPANGGIRGKMISMLKYNGVRYAHQGWTNCAMDTLFVDDEMDDTWFNARTYIVDISSLSNPIVIEKYTSGTTSIDHNQYVCGAFSYQANYAAGLRIMDASHVRTEGFSEYAYFDTSPMFDDRTFWGSWGAFPFLPSGKVIINDILGGVGVVTPKLASRQRTRKILSLNSGGGNTVCPNLVEEEACPYSTIDEPVTDVPSALVTNAPTEGIECGCDIIFCKRIMNERNWRRKKVCRRRPKRCGRCCKVKRRRRRCQ